MTEKAAEDARQRQISEIAWVAVYLIALTLLMICWANTR